MQNRMLDAADILVHRQPVIHRRLRHRHRRTWRAEPGEIPRTIHERIERIRLPPRRPGAMRAGHMLPGRVMVQRIARLVERHVIRQHHRQLRRRHRHNAAIIAMDHRNRAAPVALARNPPVTQAPVHQPLAHAQLFQPRNRRRLGRTRRRQPVQEAGIDDRPRLGIRHIPQAELRRILAGRQHHRGHRQAIFAGEIHIALVMRRAAENRPGAIFHQHEIGDPDRIRRPFDKRMLHPQPGIKPALLAGFHRHLGCARRPTLGHERRRRRVTRRHRRCQRMLRRNRQERHAIQRIRPGGVDLQPGNLPIRSRQVEGQPRALAAANPVRLHQPHPLRPPLQPIQRAQQVRREFGDPHEPLVQLLLFHRRARPPALAVDHLLIGQHRAVHRVPVHPALLPLHQPAGQEVEEQFLLMPVIAGVAGGEFPPPVQRQPHALQLGAHIGDIVPGPFARMDLALPRRILRRQPERIPPHRVQHRITARPLIPRHHIAERVVAHMPHMDLAAGIREHLQYIVFRLAIRRHIFHPEDAAGVPGLLPTRLGSLKIKTRGVGRGGRAHLRPGLSRFGELYRPEPAREQDYAHPSPPSSSLRAKRSNPEPPFIIFRYRNNIPTKTPRPLTPVLTATTNPGSPPATKA